MLRATDEPLDALRLAAASAVVERSFPLARFARLADRLAAAEGEAQARISFRTAEGVPTGSLQVRAEVVLTCQRCLGPARLLCESAVQLAFVEQDDAPVPEDCEAISGDPERVDLAALVEDELLLSLPLIPRHRAGEQCLAPEQQAKVEAGEEPEAPEMRRPFAGLKDLLKH